MWPSPSIRCRASTPSTIVQSASFRGCFLLSSPVKSVSSFFLLSRWLLLLQPFLSVAFFSAVATCCYGIFSAIPSVTINETLSILVSPSQSLGWAATLQPSRQAESSSIGGYFLSSKRNHSDVCFLSSAGRFVNSIFGASCICICSVVPSSLLLSVPPPASFA